MKNLGAISTILLLCGCAAPSTIPAAKQSSAQSAGRPIPRIDEDCFSAAAARHDETGVRFSGPDITEWDRNDTPVKDLVIEVRNDGQKTWLINLRGKKNLGFLAGYSELTMEIRDSSGKEVDLEAGDLEGVMPIRANYQELAPGSAATLRTSLGAARQLPVGRYVVDLCFWDRYQGVSKWRSDLPVFRGPVRIAPIHLSIKE